MLFLTWGLGFAFISLFKENIEYYVTTDKLNSNDFIEKNLEKNIRIGGLIVPNSVKIFHEKKEIHFEICDEKNENILQVIHHGLSTPPIFKENVGIISKGQLMIEKNPKNDHEFQKIFHSNELIGKHDENYMPPTKK